MRGLAIGPLHLMLEPWWWWTWHTVGRWVGLAVPFALFHSHPLIPR